MPPIKQNDCVLGAQNEQRIVALERDMGRVQKWITTLLAASFTTLGSAIIALVITVLKNKHG